MPPLFAGICFKKSGGACAMQFGVEKGDILRTFSPDISSNIRKILAVSTGSMK